MLSTRNQAQKCTGCRIPFIKFLEQAKDSIFIDTTTMSPFVQRHHSTRKRPEGVYILTDVNVC